VGGARHSRKFKYCKPGHTPPTTSFNTPIYGSGTISLYLSGMSIYRQQGGINLPPVVKNLIILNALVLLAQLVFDGNYQLTDKLALHPINSPNFSPYQLLTHMFTHGGFTHLLFNMIGLYVFGSTLENKWKGKRFLFCYMLAGLGAAFLHLLVQHLRLVQFNQLDIAAIKELAANHKYHATMIPTVGASGAVMGLLAAFAYLFPNTPMMIFPFPVPIKAVYMALIYVGIDLFGGLGNFSGDRIAHFAHLGGALTGFILVFIWNKTNKKTFY
jgi:membrane associated rhomboid family serine protease